MVNVQVSSFQQLSATVACIGPVPGTPKPAGHDNFSNRK
jgi:hypothetical protein